MSKNVDPGFGKTPKQLAKIFGVSEAQIKKGLKEIRKEITNPAKKKPVAKTSGKGDGMMSTKEISKVYNKAKNKKGKYDPTKIPGFGFGKGNQ